MHDFIDLDRNALDTVTGGGTSTSDTRVGLQVPKLGNINLGISDARSTTDYTNCLKTVKSMRGTPKDARETCGLPPST